MTDAVIEDDYATSSDALLDGGYALIGAVHNLVKAQGAATKRDLLLAAATHSLRSGDKSAGEVTAVVSQVWPGARTDEASVGEALLVGQELNLLQPKNGLDGTELWGLTANGADDVDRQVAWVASVKASAAEELRSRALADAGRDISRETAELWLERIVGALVVGITASQDAYLGQVEHLVTKRLAPRGIHQKTVLAEIARVDADPDVVSFLQACAIAALDPLDPFGAEIVSHITTGCVLHSYVAGRDSAAVIERLGTPAGQRAIIDTPVLVDLVGPARVSIPAATTIRAAVAAGWDVVVADHTIEELDSLMEREIPRIKESLHEAHDRGVRAEWYASLVEEQLPSYCIEAVKEGTYTNLDQMVDAAQSIADVLSELGVVVRAHYNENDIVRVERCRAALENDLEQTNSGRSTSAIQRDADTIAMMWRRRRREANGSAWSGGWVITPDRHMSAAYRAVERADAVSLTLSLAQWSTLLSVTVPPAEVVDLAGAAARQLVDEAMWLLPSRFPSDVAMDLARQISPDRGGSESDLRYMQLSFDTALRADPNRSATSIAAEVLEGRNQRRDRQSALSVERAKQSEADALRNADAARREASEQRRLADSAVADSVTSRQEGQQLKDELAWARQRTTRIVVVFSAGFVASLVCIALVILNAGLLPLLSALAGLAVLVVGGIRWCQKSDAKLLPILIGAGFEVLGLATGLLGLVGSDLSSLG
ncbi:hypothetical protein [Microbacterium sp. SZ1]|uniref:hypothetical protein n=1 Tax=Microbacterium sp. SZ1 TaxID=1849736 RepID=UPI00117CBF7C|nr:hypothetical protein [Microbacterium sp. SZ1]